MSAGVDISLRSIKKKKKRERESCIFHEDKLKNGPSRMFALGIDIFLPLFPSYSSLFATVRKIGLNRDFEIVRH